MSHPLNYDNNDSDPDVEGLTVGTVGVVHLLEAGGTGAGVRLVAGETQVAAAPVVGATAVPAPCRRDKRRARISARGFLWPIS